MGLCLDVCTVSFVQTLSLGNLREKNGASGAHPRVHSTTIWALIKHEQPLTNLLPAVKGISNRFHDRRWAVSPNDVWAVEILV